MAIIHINNIRIAGIAAGVPRNIVKTVSTTDKYDDEAYIESVGVREKRFSNEFTSSDLCEAAAKKLMWDLNWENEDIDLLMLVTQTGLYIASNSMCVAWKVRIKEKLSLL